MQRATTVFALVVFGTSLVAMAKPSDAKQMRQEIVTKADSLFQGHYIPRPDQALRTFDKDEETRPADSVIYWFDANYVVRLVFAPDGALARLELFPEALLYSDVWTSVPDTVELGQNEIRSIIATANQLQPTGDRVRPDQSFCFQSGGNLYCGDSYESASVHRYCHEYYPPRQDISQRAVTIAYKQSVMGVLSEVRIVSENEHLLMVGTLWYRIIKEDNPPSFDMMKVGSTVSLTAFGCAGNELACMASSATTPKRGS